MNKRNTFYLYIGIVLFVLFIVQDLAHLKFSFLENLQMNESYKRWSGLGLLSLIAYQWAFTLIRITVKNPLKVESFYKIHTWLGAFSPLFFYVHSTQFGFAYLFLLSLMFYANFTIGLINMDVLKQKARWFFQAWMIAHVSLSITITGLSLYHVWIVFYYN